MGSGFNLLHLRKEEESKAKRYFKRHLVIGEDLYTVSALKEVIKDVGADQVAWLSPRHVDARDLIPAGPSSLRSEANIDAFERLYPHVAVERVSAPALFYKDLKWRPFGGRAKSEPLLWGEDFYTQVRADFSYEELFPFLRDEQQLQVMLSQRIDLDVASIEKMVPDDLAEPAHFIVKTSNGDEIACEHLYWGRGPAAFANAYKDLGELESGFIEFCEGTQTPCSLSMAMEFAGFVTDMRETLFIPLSYTHEWGHFVGEFSSPIEGKQSARFITFLNQNSSSEEEISKKIRLFKRNLEKIFPQVPLLLVDEFIKISDEAPCLKVDDALFKKCRQSLKNLHFVSVNAPVELSVSDHGISADSLVGLAATARGLMVGKFLLNREVTGL